MLFDKWDAAVLCLVAFVIGMVGGAVLGPVPPPVVHIGTTCPDVQFVTPCPHGFTCLHVTDPGTDSSPFLAMPDTGIGDNPPLYRSLDGVDVPFKGPK